MNMHVMSNPFAGGLNRKSSSRVSRIFSGCLLILTIPAIFLVSVYYFKMEALAWNLLQTHTRSSQVDSLNLNDYRAALQAVTIPGVDDVSGLTYNLETNTLFTVLNKEPLLVELSLDGRILRKVRIEGVGDMEGITHISGNRYVIADEKELRLLLIDLEDGITHLDVSGAPQISLALNQDDNKNFEGVSWDGINNRLLVVKEKNPLLVLAVEGFVDTPSHASQDLRIRQAFHSDAISLRDFSSITYHDAKEHPVILSDESRLAVEYSAEGQPISMLALWKGFHGLEHNVPQAEGIAVGPDNSVYIVSEPNLFYVFNPPK
jgi:uncharacterized protein YjiK